MRIFLTAWKLLCISLLINNCLLLRLNLQSHQSENNMSVANSLKILTIFSIVLFLIAEIWTRPINNQATFLEHNHQNNGTKYESFNETSITQTPMEESEDSSSPSEVQKAVCTVTAGDVRASAEAVTTKALKGVCGSKEMHSAFNSLENKFVKQLEDVESRLAKELEIIKNLISTSLTACNKSTSVVEAVVPTKSIVLLQPIPGSNNDNSHNNNHKLKAKIPTNKHSYRAKEFSIAPNNLHNEKDQKIFTYYWKIENFTRKLENGTMGISTQTSPTFSIKDKTLRVKASFQHMHRDFLFLQLVDISASLHTSSSGNSVILDTGGLFKEIQNGNLKYKMSVIDQNAQRGVGGGKDLVSQEFDNHESGFLIPNSALSPFVKDDSLLIKIFFYL
ncbi:uncharacterized protein LOC106088797 [Stomoxys calcitrans]|uniref:uncharacterized protein LOC106088797 n=1 Tax=Stomoxys calcitrans TaxID=35570 RepID=UPI0027E2E0B0|nr:uncharacterized protein LOC106088797 [Stomoxys calcitrans]